MPALKFQIKRKCEMCGATFIAKTLESKYCSKHCIDMAYKQKKAAAKKAEQFKQIAGSCSHVLHRARHDLPSDKERGYTLYKYRGKTDTDKKDRT